MDVHGQEQVQDQDPQRLLANLTEEYERSRRFLEHLENSFVREPSPLASSSRPTNAPAWPEDPPDQQPTTSPDLSKGISPKHPGGRKLRHSESAPSKLRDKLRSFFSRRAAVREGDAGSTPGTQSTNESQSMTSCCPPPATTVVSERLVRSDGAAAAPVRRCSQKYYITSTAEVSGAPRTAAADMVRSASAVRRSSIVQFNGDVMDATAQGWVARVAGGSGDIAAPTVAATPPPPAERPGTARRASVIYFGAQGTTNAAPDLGKSVRRSADFGAMAPAPATTVLADRPATARKLSILQFGDTVAIPGGRVGYSGNYSGNSSSSGQYSYAVGGTEPDQSTTCCGEPAAVAVAISFTSASAATAKRGPPAHIPDGGAGGGLQDSSNPYEILSRPRRTTSFQQRPGAALLPTAQRLRSAVSTRRSSVEMCCNRDYASPPHSQSQQTQQRATLGSFEGRQVLAGTSSSDQISFASGRRASSLEIPRPYSAAVRHQFAATAAAAAAPGPVNITNSALFMPTSISSFTPSAAVLTAATTTTAAATAAAAATGASRNEVLPSPQNANAVPRFRAQPPLVGTAWTTIAVPSPTNSPGSTAPPSPADAAALLTVGRGRATVSSPTLRSIMSLPSKRLLNHGGNDGTPTAFAVASSPSPSSSSHNGGSPSGGAADTGRMRGTSSNGLAVAACGAGGAFYASTADGTEEMVVVEAVGALPTKSTCTTPTGASVSVKGSHAAFQGRTSNPGYLQLGHPPHQQSPPSIHHQPHPPPRPYTPTPQAHAAFRLRGFATADGTVGSGSGNGGGSGGGGGAVTAAAAIADGFSEKVPHAVDCPAVHMDERMQSASSVT